MISKHSIYASLEISNIIIDKSVLSNAILEVNPILAMIILPNDEGDVVILKVVVPQPMVIESIAIHNSVVASGHPCDNHVPSWIPLAVQ